MPPPTPADESLADLRRRVAQAREAAERLAGQVPPAGWATMPESEQTRDELAALTVLLQALRDLVPPELREQVAEVLRQVLLLLRAIIDWWVERLEGGPPGAEPEVEDIPIA